MQIFLLALYNPSIHQPVIFYPQLPLQPQHLCRLLVAGERKAAGRLRELTIWWVSLGNFSLIAID